MLQCIDMNQEGYFEESLKMRNLLQEFGLSKRALPMTILGIREHIFTGSVSSLANYMAKQETSFVTLGQRVLNKPLCSRLHYGHPDVFDKLWFMSRGGVSKASKGINLSEDIYAGYNSVVRGGSVGFKEVSKWRKCYKKLCDRNCVKEIVCQKVWQKSANPLLLQYVQVGKGRDVGSQQIYKFESKVSYESRELATVTMAH